MENKILHLIYIPFTGVGLIGYRGDEWFKDRIEVFKNYTLKSLQAQTNKNFVMWLSFRPEEENNPITADLARYFKKMGIGYIMTFDGLMYWDDKFTNSLLSKIQNCGRIIRRCWRLGAWTELLPSLRDLADDKNSTLIPRIERSLESFPPHWEKEAEYVYLTRLDSDDMLNIKYVEQVQSIKAPLPQAVVCKKGFIFNTSTGELAEWDPPTNPPFHTIIFPSPVFFEAKWHREYYGDFKSHEDIVRVFPNHFALEAAYCVTTHNPKNHISTIWNHPFRGNHADPLLIKNFGI